MHAENHGSPLSSSTELSMLQRKAEGHQAIITHWDKAQQSVTWLRHMVRIGSCILVHKRVFVIACSSVSLDCRGIRREEN